MKLCVRMIALVAAATLGNSCQVDHTRKVATAEELAFAERLVDALRYRQFQEIESEVDPTIAGQERLDSDALICAKERRCIG